MKARSFPSCSIDLCSVFLKDQFSFIVTGNESAAIILQVLEVPGVISLNRANKILIFFEMMCFLKFSITRSEQEFFFKRQILIFRCECVAKYIEG